jgi:CRISPR-associated protein Csm5
LTSHTITITGLSPLYIGSGETYSQLDYIHDDNKIYIIDFDKILTEVPMEMIEDLTNEIAENFKNNIWDGDVKEFLSHYSIDWREFIEKDYDLVGSIKKNEINQFIKTGEKIYVPGSSVKGAIRTAILFEIVKTHPDKRSDIVNNMLQFHNYRDRNVQQLIQSDGKTDLLRALQVSDLTVRNAQERTKVAESNVYHLQNKEFTIPIFNEVLYNGFVAEGTIKLNEQLATSKHVISNHFDLQKDRIIQAANNFSRDIIKFERSVFSQQANSHLERITTFYETLEDQLNNLDPSECILRLGQGSGFLAMTLFLTYHDIPEIRAHFRRNIEIFTFDNVDRRGRYSTRAGRFNIYIDRNSPSTPRNLNETWLCRIVSTQRNRNIQFVSLLEQVSPGFDPEKILYPLTRKFVVAQNELLYPYGWIKVKWD